MKLDLGKIIGVATVVKSLVESAQSLKGKTGPEKKAIVIAQATSLLPALEGVTEQDLADDALYQAAIGRLVDLEKATMRARAEVAALIADIRAKRQGS